MKQQATINRIETKQLNAFSVSISAVIMGETQLALQKAVMLDEKVFCTASCVHLHV